MLRGAFVLAMCGCGFTHGALGGGGGDGPTVGFATSSSMTTELLRQVSVRVALSEAVPDPVEVELRVAGGTATPGDDYAVTDGVLMLAPGELDTAIDIAIVEDMVDEADETIELRLQSARGAALGASAHMVTIRGSTEDLACLGSGDYAACFPAPADPVTLSGNLDTDASPHCTATAPLGWNGQPASCFVVATAITVQATSAFGSRPLVLFATQGIVVNGNLDVSSRRGGKLGPGATSAPCAAFVATPSDNTNGAGGGAGGTFRTKGGDGGTGTSAAAIAGKSPPAEPAPAILRAGCSGQKGGSSNNNANGGAPGIGGGAVYLVAGAGIAVASGVTINASGSGSDGLPASQFAGGGGGGSGGMIKLHATSITAGGAILMANGGGGSSGGDSNDASIDGADPASATMQATGGGGGNGGGAGGRGFAAGMAATGGGSDGADNGGGGGGGGGGHVESNVQLVGATVSAGP